MVENLSADTLEQISSLREQQGQINIGAGARAGANKSAAELAITASSDLQSSLAAILGDAFATTALGAADALWRLTSSSAPAGVVASFAIEVRATTADKFAFAGFYIDAGVVALGGGSRIRMSADSIVFQDTNGLVSVEALDLTVTDNLPLDVPISGGLIQIDLTTRLKNFATTLTSDATMKAPNGGKPGMAFVHEVTQDGTGGHVLGFNADELVGQAPEIDVTPGVTNVLEGRVYRINPARYLLKTSDIFMLDDVPNFTLVSQTNKGSTNTPGTAWQSGAFVPSALTGIQPGDLMFALLGAQFFSTGTPSNPFMPVEKGWRRGSPVNTSFTAIGGGGGNYINCAFAIDYKRLDSSDNNSIYPYALQTIVVRGGGVLKYLDDSFAYPIAGGNLSSTLTMGEAVAPALAVAFGVALEIPSGGSIAAEAAWATGTFDGDLAGIDRNGHNAGTNYGCSWRGAVKFENSSPADFSFAKTKNSAGSSINFLIGLAVQAAASR
jgi:hypothetical protein